MSGKTVVLKDKESGSHTLATEMDVFSDVNPIDLD